MRYLSKNSTGSQVEMTNAAVIIDILYFSAGTRYSSQVRDAVPLAESLFLEFSPIFRLVL